MAVVRVIGCGTPGAGDDAAGIDAVAGALPDLEALEGVEVIPRASPLQVVHLLRDVRAAVVVDAVRTTPGGRPAGTIVRVEAGPRGLPPGIRSTLSTHGFGIAEAFGLAAALGPTARVVVLGVEVESAVMGAPLSEPVRTALPELTARIVAEARELARASRALAREAERSAPGGPTGPTSPGGPGPR